MEHRATRLDLKRLSRAGTDQTGIASAPRGRRMKPARDRRVMPTRHGPPHPAPKNDAGTLKDDVGTLKGAHAETKARANIAVIADELGLEYRRIVPGVELRRVARENGADLRDDKIKSFVASDVMAEAIDAEGNTIYLAVEASYTGDLHDADRARSHAALMQRLTNRPCRAVVASARNNDRLVELIDSGEVAWHQVKVRIQPATEGDIGPVRRARRGERAGRCPERALRSTPAAACAGRSSGTRGRGRQEEPASQRAGGKQRRRAEGRQRPHPGEAASSLSVSVPARSHGTRRPPLPPTRRGSRPRRTE